MPTPVITATLLAERPGATTLIVGPSLGTSVASVWGPSLPYLREAFQVIGWDLPGHGASAASSEAFTLAELGDAVADLVRTERAAGTIAEGTRVIVAGDSIGGATTLHVAHDHGDLIDGAVSVCSAAKIGTPDGWHERAELVASAGTPTMVTGSAQRWFAEGFIEREPERVTNLLHDLQGTDRHAYAAACRALADYDLIPGLGDIRVPVLAIGGAEDAVCSPREQRRIAEGVPQGSYVLLAGVAHQAPAEDPEGTSRAIIAEFGDGPDAAGASGASVAAAAPVGEVAADARARAGVPLDDPYDAGMAVRREVLGASHVDRSTAAIDDVTRDFQAMITRYAWGTIWTRPGLPRETRSAITMTALIAGGFWEEYEMHVRAALRIGLTPDEIVEVALQSAIYCAVPAANHALSIAKRVLAEPDPTA
ncbi:MAG: bifunctional 3-oxoadipate enol-lactonase/4-carboxymuconolactone decarboxylase PcaDC [Pseudoclavibacter sp.]